MKILRILDVDLPINDENISFTIPARTEMVIPLKVVNPEIREGLIPRCKIPEGVYLSNAITRVHSNNVCLATIANTNNRSFTYHISKVQLEPVEINSIQYASEFVTPPNHNTHSIATDRIASVLQNLRTEHLNEEEKSSIFDICTSFSDIFHLPSDKLTVTDAISHSIQTTSDKPIHSRLYRYPEIHKKEVDSQITKMLNEGIIKPSTSPWSSPLWVVPKKLDASGEKKWRLVVDYRNLNQITIGDSFPLPNIEEILNQIGHSQYFTVLDLTSGFYQIPMSPQDTPKTAFSTPTGHYEFDRMPFGLKNSPATFQRLMNNVLTGLQGSKCFVYLDDIVVYAASLESHKQKLIEVFQRLRQNSLKLNPDKCEFLRREVTYLGHIISKDGIRPNPEKVEVIQKFPVPKNPTQIKSFLGLCGYYRKFIKDFSNISKPLTLLLHKDKKFSWTFEQQTAFEKLKGIILSSDLILQYPDFSKPFLLTTDASNVAIGAILSQGKINEDLPISFASRTLNKCEQNYSTIEKELLAIIWAIKHFRPYLYGHKFTIVSDHRPLVWLKNCKDQNSKLLRWRLLLEEYEYDIIYKPGKINKNADALSRIVHENQLFAFDELPRFSDFLKARNCNQIPNRMITANNGSIKNSTNLKILFQSGDNDETTLTSKLSLENNLKLSNSNELYSCERISGNFLISYHKQNYFDPIIYSDLFSALSTVFAYCDHNQIN